MTSQRSGKKHVLPLAFVLAWAPPAMAQLSVQSVSLAGKEDKILMPFVQAPRAVAANINDALYVELLGTLAPPGAGMPVTGAELEGIASQTFTIARNDRILTFAIVGEGCGAYCETYRHSLSFDARTGRRLGAADLLSDAGQRDVLRRLRAQKVAAYAEQLRIERATLRELGNGKDGDEVEDARQRVALNEDCLARAKAPSAGESLRWYRLDPARNALEVTAGRCSNHASQAFDDVGEVTVKIPYGALRAGLTPYGRGVLLGEGQGRPATVFGQVLRGTIGTSLVTMMLDEEGDGHVSGAYFYDRQRKRLGLSGTRRGAAIELTESVNGAASPTGRFVLTVEGPVLKGHWRDPKGARQLDVVVTAP